MSDRVSRCCAINDVIGTRCDPYINRMLSGADVHHYCHSNLIRALVKRRGLPVPEADRRMHDVLNVFMCTGFDRETHQYIKKASPVRPGVFLEFFAEIDLLAALSACPSGDCGIREPGEEPQCHPLRVEIYRAAGKRVARMVPSRSERLLRRSWGAFADVNRPSIDRKPL